MPISISILSVIPFVILLGCIALFPLFFAHIWDNNKNKLIIAMGLSIPIIIYLAINGLSGKVTHILFFDYVPFVVLIGGLYTVTGGISLQGDIEATPLINTSFLAAGAVLASLIGTTGASMLLIRSLIQTNSERRFKTHTFVFFIVIVANCGGLFTPLGDPPLFILYLQGVGFFWFLKLFPMWAVANGLFLIIYWGFDVYYHNKESKEDTVEDTIHIEPLNIHGKINFLWLLGIIVSVAFVNESVFPILKEITILAYSRELLILSFAGLSLYTTNKKVHEFNEFNWHPIQEVAYLYFGIFITMIPCILYLQQHTQEFHITTATIFYYVTGSLSAFLDNAPAALAMYSVATAIPPSTFPNELIVGGVPEVLLESICISSVFFGAITYIGNAPNLMIKSIVEHNGIAMPHFFGYFITYGLCICLPVYILIQLIFLQ